MKTLNNNPSQRSGLSRYSGKHSESVMTELQYRTGSNISNSVYDSQNLKNVTFGSGGFMTSQGIQKLTLSKLPINSSSDLNIDYN